LLALFELLIFLGRIVLRERSLGLTVAVLLVISTVASTNIFCLRSHTGVDG